MNNSYKPYNSSLYIKALLEKRRREEEQRRLQAETQKQQEERKKSDKNWWQRTTDTVSEFTTNLNEGFLGFLDGINDATAYVYGAISGNHEKAQNWMNYDWQAPVLNVINQLDIGSNLQSGDFFNGNYWQDWKNVGNAESSRESINQLHTDSWSAELGETWQNRYNSLIQGVGSALPAVALGGVGGALGLGAKGTKLLTMGSLGVSAFGGGASEALSDGATYGQAGLYGGFSAGTEILLESFNDSINGFKTNIAKNQVGKQVKKEVAGETLKELYKKGLNNVAKDTLKESTEQLTKQVIKNTLKDMVGEGFEELASDLISPSIKALTYKGKEGLKEYTDPDTYVDAIISFVGGMAGAGVGSGLQTGVGTAKYSAQGRKAIQTASEINQLQNEFNELYSEGVKNGATNTDLDNMVRDYTRAIKQKSAQLTSELSQIDPNEITKMRNTLNTVDRVKGKNTVAYSDANDDEQIKTVNQERVKTITQEYSRTAEDKYGEAVRRAFKYNGGTVNIVDSNKLKDIDYIEQTIGKPLSENEVNQILNRNSKALYVKGHVFVSNANRSQVNKLIVHEVISHGILDMDVKTRNEFLVSLRLDGRLNEQLNKISDDVLKKYNLDKKSIRRMLNYTHTNKQYSLNETFAGELDTAQSEVMAHFLEFLYDNGDISGLMNSLNKSRISKMLSNALSYLKTKGGSTQEAQRQLEKMIDKVRKNNINANTELQSQIKSSYNKEKRHPIFSSYNEARVYSDEVRKRKFRLKSYDEVGKQTIYTWENVFIVDPKNDYSFLRQYTSDEYYDLTHKGETGYDKTRNTTDNGIGENNGQETGVTIVRTDSVGKEGAGNDSLLTRETKNNQGSMRGNKKSNEIESSIEDQLFVDEMIDEGVLIKLWDNDPNIKSALSDDSDYGAVEIKEDYDISKNFKIEVNGEEETIKGIEWYESQSNKMLEWEDKLNDEEITENKYDRETEKIYDKVSDEVGKLDYILEQLEDTDLDSLDEEDIASLPKAKDIEKLLNYASKIQEFMEDFDSSNSIDFSSFVDETSNINKIYDFVKQREQRNKKAVKTPKPKVVKSEEPKQEVKTPKPKVVKNEVSKPKTENKKDTSRQYATVAPYLRNDVSINTINDVDNQINKKFVDNANSIAETFGLKIANINTNMGGFEFQEGEHKGQAVTEISYTFDLGECSQEEANLFACVLGDLGHESQEAVIAMNYLDSDQSSDIVEYEIKVNDLQHLETSLKKLKVNDYTINIKTKTIKILDFSEGSQEFLISLETLVKELQKGNNFYGIENNKISSRYLDRKSRRNAYETWLGEIKNREQKGNGSVRSNKGQSASKPLKEQEKLIVSALNVLKEEISKKNIINGVNTNKTIDIKVKGQAEAETLQSIKGIEENYNRSLTPLIAELSLKTNAKKLRELYETIDKTDDTNKAEKLKTVSAYIQAFDEFAKSNNQGLNLGLEEYYNAELRKQNVEERKQKAREERAKAVAEKVKQEAKQEIKTPKPKVVKAEETKSVKTKKETPKPKVEKKARKILQLNDKVDLRKYIDTLGYNEINEYAVDFGTIESKLENIESKRSNEEVTCDVMQAYIENVCTEIDNLRNKIFKRANSKNKSHSINVLKCLYNKTSEIEKRFLVKENNIFKGRKLLEKDIEAGETVKGFYSDISQIVKESKDNIKVKIEELVSANLEDVKEVSENVERTSGSGITNNSESVENNQIQQEIESRREEGAEIFGVGARIERREQPNTSGNIDTSSYYGFSTTNGRNERSLGGAKAEEEVHGRGTSGGLHGLRGLETQETTTNVVETPTETHEVAQETTFSDETISKITNKKKQEIKKIKVIIQNTRRVATKTVSSVKAEADFYNKVVYSVESDAKPLREKISKYLSTKGQELVANGKGTNLVDFEVLCVMDSVDSNLTLDKRVEKIYEIYAQFIKVDKNITNYIKREIRKALENGGKPSKMAKLKAEFEAKNMKNVEIMQVQVDNLLGKLTTAQEQVEIYKSQVTELQNEVNKITSENTKNDKETAKEIKKLKTELNKVNAKLTDKESTNAELKSQIKEVKAEIKASKEALTKKENLINSLKEKTQKAQTEKVEAKTEVQGKKVVSQDFRDTLELTDILKDFKTVGEVKMSDKLYEDIALHLSKGHIKTAVNMYLTFVGNIKVEVNGVTQTLKDSSAEWAEFETQIRKAFEDYYDTAKKSTAVEIQEENEALTYATVAVIKASFAIKRKLNKKTGVIQPLKPLAKNLVSKISKVSITSLKNGAYRKAIKELHDELITKKDGMSILDRIDYEFDKELLDKMNRFGNGKGKLTKQDMYDIMDIMRGFSVFLSKASGATLYDGKTVSQHSVDAIQMQKKNGVHKWKPVLNAVSPRVAFEYMDSYKEDGFNTYVYNKLLDGEVVEQQSYLELFGILDKFYKSKDGKKVKGKLLDEVSIKVDGWNHEFTATVGEYMSIYKLLNREDAKKHLLKSGLCLRRQKKSRLGKITGKKQYEFIEQRFTEETLENFKKAIEEKFNLNSDDSMYKKFIDVTTEFFEKAKEYKMDTDKATRGYTNVIKGEEYFPIKVVAFDMLMNMGENQDFMSSAMAGSRNFSFNASVEGSKGMLEISNILDVMNIYGNQMAKYRAYAETIDMINSVFNYKLQSDDVSEGLYVGETLRNIMAHNFGANGNKHSNVIEYYNNLLRDLQGIREYDEALLEKIRKNFASFQLGANLKVMANQLSAIPTMLKYISLDNFAKAHKTLLLLGFDSKVDDMPTTAQYRMKLHQALSTNMISDKVGKTQEFFGKGMEFSDNVVLKMVWTACKMQAKNDLVKAEKLFNKIIRETQGFNTLQRSQLLRSGNSIVRFLMMFKVQPSHNLSNLVECIQHIRANKQTGNKMTKEQKRMYTGAVVGLLLEGAMYTAIGLLFKRLLGRDEEDDLEIQNILETFFNDNMIGMIPFLDQIEVDFDKDSGKFLKINELNVSALQQVSDALTDLQNATDKEAHISERITSYANAIGRLTGIPTRNINNYTTMFLKKIVPDFAFKWEIESNGYTLSNKSQVNSALTNNQSEKAWQYYKNYNNKIVELDEKTNEIMFNLYKEGYKDVYVKQIPSTMDTTTATITVDKNKFKRTYSKLTIPLKRMTNNYMFKELSKIEQEEVLQRLVDCYYNIAYKEQSKKQMTLLESLASDGFDINKYLIHITKISNFEGTIGMSKKDIAVEYIDRLHLTKDEKNLLYLLAGYSVGQEALDNVIKYLKARGVSYITLKRQLMSDDSTVGKIIRARSY